MVAAATARLKCKPPRGRMPVLQYLRPSEIEIDPTYQRSIENGGSQSLIRKIAQQWDWDLCQPLVVAARPSGQMMVIDGQHRLAAARMRGDIDQLPCTILHHTSAAEEAASFVALNQMRRPLNGLEVFRAAVASGDAEAAAIKAAVEKSGLVIATHTNNASYKPGEIGNIGGLRKAWRTHGPNVTAKALRVMATAFAGQKILYAGTTFPGIVAVLAARPKIAACDLAQALSARGQSAIYSEVMKVRGTNPDLNFDNTSAMVIHQLLRAALGEPEPSGSNAPSVDLAKFQDGRAWCNQCESRVSINKAGACVSQFCKLKAAPVAAAQATA